MGSVEEFVLSRWGLLGLAVLALITFGPRLLDRLTAWAIKHAENEDRSEEKVTDAFIDELKRSGLERESARQERIQMIAAQNNLAIAMHALRGDIDALRGNISGLRDDIRQHTVFIQDLDARLSLYFNSRGGNTP